MELKGFARQRQKVFEAIVNFLQEEGKVEREKLEARIQFESGLSQEKAEEYIDICLKAGEIDEEDGDVFYVGDSE